MLYWNDLQRKLDDAVTALSVATSSMSNSLHQNRSSMEHEEYIGISNDLVVLETSLTQVIELQRRLPSVFVDIDRRIAEAEDERTKP